MPCTLISADQCDSYSRLVVEYEHERFRGDWLWTDDTENDDHVFCRFVRPIPPVTPSVVGDTLAISVDEDGQETEYVVQLLSKPRYDVVVEIVPDRQLLVEPSAVTFTPDNWEAGALIHVAAVSDFMVDFTHHGSISHVFTSRDAFYQRFETGSVNALIEDNGKYSPGVVARPSTVLGCSDPSLSITFHRRRSITRVHIARTFGCTDYTHQLRCTRKYLITTTAQQELTAVQKSRLTITIQTRHTTRTGHAHDVCLAGMHNCSDGATCNSWVTNYLRVQPWIHGRWISGLPRKVALMKHIILIPTRLSCWKTSVSLGAMAVSMTRCSISTHQLYRQ